MSRRVLAVRQDNNGDVLLVGPALRALAASVHVDLLCGPRGASAGALLPGIERVFSWEAAWIDAEPRSVMRADVNAFVDFIANRYDEAIVFTSFHQSPLPMALLLRMAGMPRIGAISVDYPGSLLDVRHRLDDQLHEVERALSLVRSMGYELPEADDDRLRLREVPPTQVASDCYVVVHPGCTMPARTWHAERFKETVCVLGDAGFDVAVTGSRDERALTAYVASAHRRALDFGGRTTFATFAGIIQGAAAVVCGNTAAAHVAAAVATPVVQVFPPTIPFVRFSPWRVQYEVFGNFAILCAGCRARECPWGDQPCLRDVTPQAIARAVGRMARRVELAS